jgi:hypothetical protein
VNVHENPQVDDGGYPGVYAYNPERMGGGRVQHIKIDRLPTGFIHHKAKNRHSWK